MSQLRERKQKMFGMFLFYNNIQHFLYLLLFCISINRLVHRNHNHQQLKHEWVFTSVMMALCCRTLWYSGSSLTVCVVESCIALPSRHRTAWHLPTFAAFRVKQPPCSPGATGSCLMWHRAAEPPILWPAVPSFLQEKKHTSSGVCMITVCGSGVIVLLLCESNTLCVYRCMVRKVLVM